MTKNTKTEPYIYKCAFCEKQYYLVHDLILHEQRTHLENNEKKHEDGLDTKEEV